MKTIKTLFIAVAILLVSSSAFAESKIVKKSDLPQNAKAFIMDNFSSKIQTVEIDDDEYKVMLADGSELEFDLYGQFHEVCACDSKTCSSKIIKNVLPKKAVKYLDEQKELKNVKQISFNFEKGYEVELTNDKKYMFSKSGA